MQELSSFDLTPVSGSGGSMPGDHYVLWRLDRRIFTDDTIFAASSLAAAPALVAVSFKTSKEII